MTTLGSKILELQEHELMQQLSRAMSSTVILNDDIVVMNLAGGANMATHGEAILAIPLLDGRAQAMVATMVNQVTRTFPMFDTVSYTHLTLPTKRIV